MATRVHTWQQPPLPHVTWAAGAGPGRLLPASAWWSESLSAPYTTLPSGWPGQQRGVTASAVLGSIGCTISVIVQVHRLIVHSSTQHQHHHITGSHQHTRNISLAHSPLSSLSAPPQFFISTYLLLRDLEGLEVVADHPELLLQLHDLGLAGLGSLLRALEVGLHHGELPGDLGSSALDGALLS